MKVVLLRDVPELGKLGDVKEVASGYARNYLLPKGMAEYVTPAVLQRVEAQRRREERAAREFETEMAKVAAALEGVQITLRAKVGEQDRLYGSITSADIAEELRRVSGYEVDKKSVELEEPIRQLGQYEIPVRLSKEQLPKVKVVVEEEKA
jgi:large subunit ribosomal protein L9